MKKNEIIFGTRAVMETIQAGKEIEKIIIQAGLNHPLIRELLALVNKHKISCSFAPRQKLNKLTYKNHQGVVCILSAIRYSNLENLIYKSYGDGQDPCLLLLDRITDVGNFGAIVRTAECAGIDAIVITEKESAPITGDAIKTSSGALSLFPICRTPHLTKTIQNLKDHGLKIIACLEKAEKTLYEIDLCSPLALVIGSEKDGISSAILREADEVVKIPMYGAIKSLNVSVATGIALYEIIRQKKHAKRIE